MKLLPFAPKFLRLIRYILGQFWTPFKKIVRETPISGGRCASKTWSFYNARKNLGVQHPQGAEIWYSEKGAFGGYDFTSRSPRLLDRSSSGLVSPNVGEIAVDQILVRFWISSSLSKIFAAELRSHPKSSKFCMFLGPKIFWGGPQKPPKNFGPAL